MEPRDHDQPHEGTHADHRDALPAGPVRGRGAGLNPGNRFESIRLHVLGEAMEAERAERSADAGRQEGRRVPTQIFEDQTRSVLNKVESPDIPFSWSLNPYRGCEHGCIYCYARPGHEFLGLSMGLDFETKIHAKPRAAEILREELSRPRWLGETIALSGVTDPWQPIEREQEITRRCLEVLVEHRQATAVITKNKLILRDLDLLAALAAHGAVHAAVSITTLDNELAAKMEPRASSPRDRLTAIRELTRAGIPVRIMTAPMIPGLNDHEMPKILEAAAEAGAVGAGYAMLRLPYQIKDLFMEWLTRNFPDRAGKVESLIRQVRGGELNTAEFGTRMRGEGPIAAKVSATFNIFARRYGLDQPLPKLNQAAFVRPSRGELSLRRDAQEGQGMLFLGGG
jgi:DNA repair photolyase